MQGSQTLGKTKKPKTTGQRLSAGNIEVRHIITNYGFSLAIFCRFIFYMITSHLNEIENGGG